MGKRRTLRDLGLDLRCLAIMLNGGCITTEAAVARLELYAEELFKRSKRG